MIKNPLWVIQRQVQDLQKAAASINRITQLYAEQPTILDGPNNQLPAGALALRFEDVSFFYADDPETHVLRDIDFTLEAGQVLGLLGRTGSGKTTMTRLLFHATVRDNLTLFDDSIEDEQISAALDELGLTPWLDSLPEGLDTRLESDDSISAGEAQLLVFDDLSSALDVETEQLLWERLFTAENGDLEAKTCLVVSHRREMQRLWRGE